MAGFFTWFKNSFGQYAPTEFAAFVTAHPDGVTGRSGEIWAQGNILDTTVAEDLAAVSVCMFGAAGDGWRFLLRAKDGKVFIVRSDDYSVVDASFASFESFLRILDFGN